MIVIVIIIVIIVQWGDAASAEAAGSPGFMGWSNNHFSFCL